MGVCMYSHDFSGDFETLLRYADQALYRAKAHKRERKRYWEIFNMDEAGEGSDTATVIDKKSNRHPAE